MKTAEQRARDMLERIEIQNAQSFSAGELVELANLIARFDRCVTLLRAAHALLKLQDESHYVRNLLMETVRYDDADCDGWCLMQDIESEIGDVLQDDHTPELRQYDSDTA